MIALSLIFGVIFSFSFTFAQNHLEQIPPVYKTDCHTARNLVAVAGKLMADLKFLCAADSGSEFSIIYREQKDSPWREKKIISVEGSSDVFVRYTIDFCRQRNLSSFQIETALLSFKRKLPDGTLRQYSFPISEIAGSHSCAREKVITTARWQ